MALEPLQIWSSDLVTKLQGHKRHPFQRRTVNLVHELTIRGTFIRGR